MSVVSPVTASLGVGPEDVAYPRFWVGSTVNARGQVLTDDGTAIQGQGATFLWRRPDGVQIEMDGTWDETALTWRCAYEPDWEGTGAVRLRSLSPQRQTAWQVFDVVPAPTDAPPPPASIWVSQADRALTTGNGGLVSAVRIAELPRAPALDRNSVIPVVSRATATPEAPLDTLSATLGDIQDQANAAAAEYVLPRAEQVATEKSQEVAQQVAQETIPPLAAEAGAAAGVEAVQPLKEAAETAATNAATSEEIATGAADLARDERIAAGTSATLADQRAADAEAARKAADTSQQDAAEHAQAAQDARGQAEGARDQAEAYALPPAERTMVGLRARDTVNALDQTVVYLLGYYAPWDGGEGQFVLDLTSTATHDGGFVIQPLDRPSGPGRWIRTRSNPEVNVKQFGAKGDGSDDHAAITAAMAYVENGGGLLFSAPSNFYGISAPLVKPDRSMTIRGVSERQTVIRALAPMEAVMIWQNATSQASNMFELTLDANGLADYAFYQKIDSLPKIHHCTFTNGKVADHRQGSTDTNSGRVRGGMYNNINMRKQDSVFPLSNAVPVSQVSGVGNTAAPTGWSIEATPGLTASFTATGGATSGSNRPTYKVVTCVGGGTVSLAFVDAGTIPAQRGDRWTYAVYNVVSRVASGRVSAMTFTTQELDAAGNLLREDTTLTPFIADEQIPPVGTQVESHRITAWDIVEHPNTASLRFKVNYVVDPGSDLDLRVALPGAFNSTSLPKYNLWLYNTSDAHYTDIVMNGGAQANLYDQTYGNNGFTNLHAWGGATERAPAFNFFHQGGNSRHANAFSDGALVGSMFAGGWETRWVGGIGILAPLGILMRSGIDRCAIIGFGNAHALQNQVQIGEFDWNTWTYTTDGELGSRCQVMITYSPNNSMTGCYARNAQRGTDATRGISFARDSLMEGRDTFMCGPGGWDGGVSKFVHSGGDPYGAMGGNQFEIGHLVAQTNSATAVRLTSDGRTSSIGSTNVFRLPRSGIRVMALDLEIVAVTSTGADVAWWNAKGLYTMVGGVLTSLKLIGTPSITKLFGSTNTSAWSVALSTDSGLGAPRINVTGAGPGGETVFWKAALRATALGVAL